MLIIVTLGEIISFIIIVLILIILICMSTRTWIKQKRCKHINYYETMSCDAICCLCGKNLGFIGDHRRKN